MRYQRTSTRNPRSIRVAKKSKSSFNFKKIRERRKKELSEGV